MVGSGQEYDRAGSRLAGKFDAGEDIGYGDAMKVGTPGQACNSCVTWRQADAFRGQVFVGCTGPQHNPVTIIAGLRGNLDEPLEDRAGLQFQRVAATRIVDRVLQIVSLLHHANATRGRCVSD